MLWFLLDVDGVIFDYNLPFLQAAEEVLGRQFDQNLLHTKWEVEDSLGLTEEETAEVYKVINSPGHAQDLPPLPGAIEGATELARHGAVFFVTSPLKSSPTWGFDRGQALLKYFGDELGSRYISTSHKYAVDGDALVDDKPDNLSKWTLARQARMGHSGLPICWAYPHNVNCGFLRMSEWEPLIEIAQVGRSV